MFLIIFQFLLFAKEPVNLQLQKHIPKAPQKNEIDLSEFKNIELKKESKPFDPSSVCTSQAGVEYKAGTENYNSCMQEQNRFTPPGFDPNKRNQ